MKRRLFAVALPLFVAVLARGQVWVEQGPGPNTLGQVEGITDRKVVGAIHAVAIHPSDANTIYVGAVNGGIWKTTNGTAADPAWVEQLGLNRSLSIGALAFDPTDATSNTLMAGSGATSSFLGLGGDRVGVWHTTNGGANWNLLTGGGTLAGLNIIGVAPRGATMVIAVNDAPVANDAGIWRSTDTGAMWTKISGGAMTGLPNGVAFDLASDPTDNTRLFTNAGALGVYRSTNTGETWQKVSDAAMDAILGAGGLSNVEIAVGTSNNVYVAIVRFGRLAGLFRSGNGGDNWTPLDLPTTTENGLAIGIHPGGQGGTHMSIAAHPTNANVVFVGGDRQPFRDEGTTNTCAPCWPNSINAQDFTGRLFRVDASLAPGTQAAPITHVNTSGNSAPHGDSRDMAVDPNGDLIEVDDGGIYRRTTPLLNTGNWFSVIGNLRTTEFHSIAWDSNSKNVAGGAQDTGTPMQRLPGNLRWRSISTADGGDVGVDATSTPGLSIRYSSFQNFLNFRRVTFNAGGAATAQVFPALTVVGGGAALAAQFYTPIAVNNVAPTRLLIGGGNSLYESLNQGDTIREIGPGISVNGTGADPIAYGATGNPDVIYAGAFDQVFVRTAAAPAAPVQSATYPGTGTGRFVMDIAVHRGDPLTAFVVDPTNVYFTTNAGAGWTNITGNLLTLSPGLLRSIAFSTSNATGRVIVGSDKGVFSATGPAFNSWSALGTGLPRAPVFDLMYDPKDEVLTAGLMGRGSWTTVLAERGPVDVALVLDLSGSMLSPACGGCDTRLQVLKDAVEIFVQLWTVFAVPNDRMALSYFRTNVSELTPGGVPLFPVLANAPALIADVQSQTTVATNLTAMGGGLQTAINRLTTAARPRSVILFTDGMQNVNPMVNASTFVIENQPGFPASGVSPTMPPTDLNAAFGRKVNTIGVGATPPFVDLLDDIASETNGVFKLTTAPDDDLRQFYVEELIDVLRTFSPQLVGYRKGTVAPASAEEFVSNGTARRVVLKLSWKRGAKLDFTVEKDGVPIQRAGRVIEGAFYKIFTIDVPATDVSGPITPGGTWRMRITGTPGAAYEAAAIVDEEALKYELSIGGRDHVAGTPLPLSVKLMLGTQPVTDATVTARVRAPKQGLGTLLSKARTPSNLAALAYEPGATDAQRKYQLLLGDRTFFAQLQPREETIALAHAGGGVYTATFTDTALAGTYTAAFDISGTRADIGAYRRTEQRSVTLRFGTAVLSASDLRIASVGRTPEGLRRYELRVKPVDAAGNFLGPDSGHRIAVFVNGTQVPGPPRDLLDGSYAFELAVPEPASSANVKVTVMDQPLFDGALGDIPTGNAGGGRFAFSLHLGSTIPLTGFPSSASDGYLGEVDFEYRRTPSFSLEGVLGYYHFGKAGAITGFTAYAKKYFDTATAWRWYGAIGPGAYKSPADTDLGASLAAGLSLRVAPRTEFDTGAVYTHVFGGTDAGWLGLRVGVKVSF